VALDKLKQVFNRDINKCCFKTRYPRDLQDFVSAFLALNEEYHTIKDKCLIISNLEDWENLIDNAAAGHIFVASERLNMSEQEGMDIIQKTISKHGCLFWGSAVFSKFTELKQPTEYHLKNELKNGGYTERRAEILTQKSSSDLYKLLRIIQDISEVPDWATPSSASDLAIANLLGKWNESNQDERDVIGDLLGGDYEEWIKVIRSILNRPTTPLNFQDGKWVFTNRYEGWMSLGRYIFDDHLDRFYKISLDILREIDPKLNFTDEKVIFAPERKFSNRIRKGITETLCLLSAYPEALPNISIGKAQLTVNKIILELFERKDWEMLASLDDVFPLIAEAAPEIFLEKMEEILEKSPDTFSKLFSHTKHSIFTSGYFTGLMWSFQVLAWKSELLPRIILILGGLSSLDPGGNFYPRPFSSIISLLIPWFPQTCANVDLRMSAIKELVKENPEIAWKLVLNMIEVPRSSSSNPHPIWAEWIPIDWQNGSKQNDYSKEINFYHELALNIAKRSNELFLDLIPFLNRFSEENFNKIIKILMNTEALSIDAEKKFKLWKILRHEIIQNKKFAEPWGSRALNPLRISKLELVSKNLIPEQISISSEGVSIWDLFNEVTLELPDNIKNTQEYYSDLERRRIDAVDKFFNEKGIDGILEFSSLINFKHKFGNAAGKIDGISSPPLFRRLLRDYSKEFTSSFIYSCFWQNGKWGWYDELDLSEWSFEEELSLLLILPCTREAWNLVTERLGDKENEYWRKTTGNPIAPKESSDLMYLVEKYLSVGRPYPAIWMLTLPEYQNRESLPFPSELAYRALKIFAQTPKDKEDSTLDPKLRGYTIMKLIQNLQNRSDLPIQDMRNLEWIFLPLFYHFGQKNMKAINLENQIATEPKFFCEIIFNISLPDNYYENESKSEKGEFNQDIFKRYYNLFENWSILPGVENGLVNKKELMEWINKVKSKCEEKGYTKVCLEKLGKILARYPPDPSGLWIHRTIAAILNDRGAKEMRHGFHIETYNSRGVSLTDGTGSTERRIGDEYVIKADKLTKEGFHRLAQTIRGLADSYYNSAERMAKRMFS
jgi:hypothetical protein